MSESNSCNSVPDSSQQSLLPTLEASSSQDTPPTGESTSGWRDFLGITASVACAIHCAAMPFVIGFLPALGLSFLADESFHKWMAGACFAIALAAFVPGWKRHRRCLPAAVAATGLMIVSTAAFGMSGECCAACESAADTPSCCASDCKFCATESAVSEADGGSAGPAQPTESQASILPAFITNYAAWWTPLGGALLVFGHLLNRCFVSRCVCCNPAA